MAGRPQAHPASRTTEAPVDTRSRTWLYVWPGDNSLQPPKGTDTVTTVHLDTEPRPGVCDGSARWAGQGVGPIHVIDGETEAQATKQTEITQPGSPSSRFRAPPWGVWARGGLQCFPGGRPSSAGEKECEVVMWPNSQHGLGRGVTAGRLAERSWALFLTPRVLGFLV